MGPSSYKECSQAVHLSPLLLSTSSAGEAAAVGLSAVCGSVALGKGIALSSLSSAAKLISVLRWWHVRFSQQASWTSTKYLLWVSAQLCTLQASIFPITVSRVGQAYWLFDLQPPPRSCLGAKLIQSCPALCESMDCSLPSSSVHGDSPSKNIGVGCHALLQGIFPTQGSTCISYVSCIGRRVLYHQHQLGSPRHPNLLHRDSCSVINVQLIVNQREEKKGTTQTTWCWCCYTSYALIGF